MIRYRVVQGDCASSIANQFGFRDFRTLWDAPDNAELRSLRPDPNVLFPGDVVVVPDHELRVEEAETGRRHTFVARGKSPVLRLRIETDQPLDYELVVERGEPFRGTTDGSAPIVHPISASARSATLTLWPSSMSDKTPDKGMRIPVAIGALDPIDEIAGVQGRLRNLGFYDGPLDNRLEDLTREGIRAFERYLGREETGEPTASLRAALVQHHDVAS